MFDFLFNTYEAVTPPKSEQTITLSKPDQSYSSLLTNPFTKSSFSDSPPTESPDDEWNNFILSKTQRISSQVADQSIIDNIISTGREFLNTPYTWGGKTPKSGFDCSGLLTYIYRKNGVDLPDGSSAIGHSGTSVSLDEARPGDIIYSNGKRPDGSRGGHVQMITKIENGTIYVLGAQSRKTGITEDKLKTAKKDIISVRRVINSNINLSKNDPFLVDTTLTAPSKYNSKEKFVSNLNQAYKKSLTKLGLSPQYSLALTAWSAMESGWGTAVPADYNYSGIKTNGTNGKVASTKEYDSAGRQYTIKARFRNFKSLQDFTDYKVSLVFGPRYHLQTFNPNDVYGMIQNAIKNGYGTANANIYASKVQQIYNKINKNYA